jgi:hypothetical protein
MKKVILAAIAVLSLAACGKETVREVLVTTPPTEAPAVEVNKFDQYLLDVRNGSAQAKTMTDEELLKFGTLICDTFNAGKSLDQIVTLLASYSTGSYDTDLYAMIILGAVKNICPEWKTYVAAASS